MPRPRWRSPHEPREARAARAAANRWRSAHGARSSAYASKTTERGARRGVPWETLLLTLVILATAVALVAAVLNPL